MSLFKRNTNPFNIQVGDVIEIPATYDGDREVMVIEVANEYVSVMTQGGIGFRGHVFTNPAKKSGNLYFGIMDGIDRTQGWRSLRNEIKNGEARKIASFGSSVEGFKAAEKACKDLNSAIWDEVAYAGAA